jgi:uncharacterized phage protein (TIGR02216 family)
MSDRIDWRALVRVGLCDLRLHPETFWALTPAEFLVMAGFGNAAPMTRLGLRRLQAQFPDSKEKADPHG